MFLQASGGSVNFGMLFPLIIFLIFYLFFIRPSAKKQKEQKTFSDDLAKGDEVVTSSGIIARVNKIEGEVVHLQIDQKTFIKVVRAAISSEMTEQYKKSLTN